MRKVIKEWLFALVATCVLLAGFTGGIYTIWNAVLAPPDNLESLALPMPAPWKGDFDGMKERRLIRILVPNNKTWYFLDGARERGIIYDYGKALERWINKKYKIKYNQAIRVVFIPTSRDKLLTNLEDGLGDIATGGLTVTEHRKEIVSFANPLIKDVKELVITAPNAPAIKTLDDLAGQEIYIRKSSSYWEHLEALNKKFSEEGKPQMTLIEADENLEDEDILEMVNVNLINITVMDRFLAIYWKKVFSKINIHEDIVISGNGTIAWAVRKDDPLLKAEMDDFMKTHAFGTLFQKIVMLRYFAPTEYVVNATSQTEMKKFNAVVELFKRYAVKYDFDYLMLIAQGYQESGLNQSARSKRGAVGIMQVLPSTAIHPPISIPDVDKNVENNIHAGVKYLHVLANQYVNQPDIDPKNRLLLTFAAYNAGPGNLHKFREFAKKSGLNPNIWFNNVEIAASRIVGRETVDYVGNIYQYYIAYHLVKIHQEEAHKEGLEQQH